MKTNKVFLGLITFSILVIGISCKQNDPVVIDTTPYVLEYGSLPKPNIPSDNQLTEKGVELGRMLFYEKKLSKDNSIACASCHKQENAFDDPKRFSEGVGGSFGKRQSMAAFNMAWNSNEFFWDGRAHLLRDQALLPIQDPLEMDESLENVISKLSEEDSYKDQFMLAFGSEEITSEKISLALEQFMNSIVSYQSKYDQSLTGQATLSDQEERGRVLFFAEFNPGFPATSGADCAHCHSGSNFENDQYMNNGLDLASDLEDFGREEATGEVSDRGKFKVTTLRNIALTGPYMHDGRFSTLMEVINHYNNGLDSSATLDPALEYTRISGGLGLSQSQKEDLEAFLKTLTDDSLLTDEKYSDPF